MNYPTLRCGCEYGENCDKVSLCALNNAVEEKDEEIEELNTKLKRLRAMLEKANYLSAEVKEAWERERISIDTVNAAIAFDDAYSERGTTR
jgi:predicted xylose isomerase-like sugar epimerase